MAYPDIKNWKAISRGNWGVSAKRLGVEGASSLKIQLQDSPSPQGAGDVLTFHSLGAEPELVITLADRSRLHALAWGLALAVGLAGLAMTNRPVRRKISFLFAVGLVATLLPLISDGLEAAEIGNMVFYAVSLLVPYYLLAGLLKWCIGGCCRVCGCTLASRAAATGLMIVLLAAAAGHASAQANTKKGGPAESSVKTPVKQNIETVLNSSTKLEFVDTPLTDVIDYLKDYHHIKIQLDKKAMADASIEPDVTMTKNLAGVSLRSGLNLMLRELGLTYVIQGDGLLITTSEAAAAMLTTRTYPITDLVEMARDTRGKPMADVQRDHRPDSQHHLADHLG